MLQYVLISFLFYCYKHYLINFASKGQLEWKMLTVLKECKNYFQKCRHIRVGKTMFVVVFYHKTKTLHGGALIETPPSPKHWG